MALEVLDFFAFPFALDDDVNRFTLYPLDGFLARPPRPFPFAHARGSWGADFLQACLPFGGD